MLQHLKLKLIAGILAALLILLLAGCSTGRSTGSIAAVKNFDASRYMGKWYEIARLPHSFEDDITDVQALYTMQKNGDIIVKNSGLRRGTAVAAYGIARTVKPADTGELEVSFFGPFYGIYKIIYLNSDYTLAIVTGSTMDYLWILARTPVISKEELATALALAKKWGFTVNLLQYPTGMVENLTLQTM